VIQTSSFAAAYVCQTRQSRGTARRATSLCLTGPAFDRPRTGRIGVAVILLVLASLIGPFHVNLYVIQVVDCRNSEASKPAYDGLPHGPNGPVTVVHRPRVRAIGAPSISKSARPEISHQSVRPNRMRLHGPSRSRRERR
jgi:hypothetical protein